MEGGDGMTSAILGEAVGHALAQQDAKLAFEMLLLNEQARHRYDHGEHIGVCIVKEADADCEGREDAGRALQDENALLKARLAAQTQEQSDMYQYLHAKLDAQVAASAALEAELLAARREREQLEETHAAAAGEQLEQHAEVERMLRRELARLRHELDQVQLFVEEKAELEADRASLRLKVETQRAEFDEAARELERRALVERERAKQELLARMAQTKEALVARTEGQLSAATRRAMMESEHAVDELAFQSREADKLLARVADMERELRALRVANGVLEANERVLARKTRVYQRIVQKLRRAGDRRALAALLPAEDAALVEGDESESNEEAGSFNEAEEDAAEAEEDRARLRARAEALEARLARALEWMRAFEREKRFALAQQDEVLQFLLSALSREELRKEAAVEATQSAQQQQRAASSAVEATTTMADFVRLFPLQAPLDELAPGEARALLRFLVDKLRRYQQKVAVVYADPKARDALERQLGVELPPLHASASSAASAAAASPGPASPLKRRVFAHVAAAVTSARDELETDARPARSPARGAVAPELLAVASAEFNFFNTGPARKTLKLPANSSSTSSSSSAMRKSPASTVARSPVKRSGLEVVAPAVRLAPSASTAELLTPWSAAGPSDGDAF